MTHLSNPRKTRPETVTTSLDVGTKYLRAIEQIAEDHDPSKSPFFKRLRDLPDVVAADPDMLGQIHLVYQSAMHATRAGGLLPAAPGQPGDAEAEAADFHR